MSEHSINPEHDGDQKTQVAEQVEKVFELTPETCMSAEYLPPDEDPVDEDEYRESGKKTTQKQRLQRIAESGARYFRDENEEAYAFITSDCPERGKCLALGQGGGDVWHWLASCYREETGEIPANTPLSEVSKFCISTAKRGPVLEVARRVHQTDDAIYLDLCDEARRVAEVTGERWIVRNAADLSGAAWHFYRPRTARPLAEPVYAGDPGGLSLLRDLLNTDEAGFVLCVSWLLYCLTAGKPYPVLVLTGQQGASKSTAARLMRKIVDNADPLSARPPRDPDDLFAFGKHNFVISFDNVSSINPTLSDDLSSIATTGALPRRQKYTDSELHTFTVRRPIILNGIGEFATRPDLLDRSLVVTLDPIPEDRRLDERTYWRRADECLPLILGSLLTAASAALRHLDEVTAERRPLPRMADFALWVRAAERGGGLPWRAGLFDEVYSENRANALTDIIAADAFAEAVMQIGLRKDGFTGTATTLLSEASSFVSERLSERPSDWPRLASEVGKRLSALTPALNAVGVLVDQRKSNGLRRIMVYPATALTGDDVK